MLSQLNKYITFEFCKDLLKNFCVFFILLLLIITVDELNFLKKIEDFNFTIFFKLILLKIPGILINFSPFIFLFAGILFHMRLKTRNEVIVIRTIGISNLKLISVSAIFALILGFVIIFILNPLTSLTTKEYENTRSNYLQNKNSIFLNDTGLWILVKDEDGKKIVRIESLDFNKNLLKNVTIFDFNKNFDLQSRVDFKEGVFNNKNIKLFDGNMYEDKKRNKKISEFQININFTITEVQNTFKNSSSVSIYDIQNQIQKIQYLGYTTDYLKIEFHKLMALPVYLLAMVILSGIMIINLGTNMSYIFYVIIGVIISVILYFLSDLSITLGKTEKINLELSVWLPIFLIMLVNFIGIIQVNAK